jgi:hypothetical protein
MVLFHNLVPVFDLPGDARCFASGIDLIDHRLVGGRHLSNAIGVLGLVRKAHGCCLVAPSHLQEVDRLA